MNVSFTNKVLPNYFTGIQKLVSIPSFSHTKETKLPSVGSAFYPVSINRTNVYQNQIWSQMFDTAFQTGNVSQLLNYINSQSKLRPLFPATTVCDLRQTSYVKDPDNKDFPIVSSTIKAQSKPHDLSVTATKSGHIQIDHDYFGKLFIERNELDKIMDDVNKDIIADGARGFDPFDQDDWNKVIGRNWPTAEDTRAKEGVSNVYFDQSGLGILLDTPLTVGKSYQTRPKGLTILDSENNSVIIGFQQENQNPSVDFGAWSILPFRIRDNKKTMAIFPIESRTIDQYQTAGSENILEMQKSGQWQVDNKNKFFIVDASKPSPKSEYIDPDADWCILGAEGDDKVYLVRSCFKDNSDSKQFKAFSGSEKGGGTKYVELEFIAPKVKKNSKSTLIYRLDFISLSQMGLPALTKENMDTVLKQSASDINNRMDMVRKQSESCFISSYK